MDFLLIGLFIVLIVAIVLVFKFVKHIVSAILIALFLILAVLCGIGYATYLDVQDIRAHAADKNLLLFEDDTSVIFAAEFTLSNQGKINQDINTTDSFVFIDQSSFDKNNLDYSGLHNTYFKIVELNKRISDDLFADEVLFPFGKDNSTVSISKENVLTFISGDTPIEDTVNFMVDQKESTLNVSDIAEFKQNLTQNILSETKTEEGFKGYLVGFFLATKVKENPANAIKNLVLHYKKQDIKVNKNTILFSLMDMTPSAIMSGVIDKFSEKMNTGDAQNVAVSKKE